MGEVPVVVFAAPIIGLSVGLFWLIFGRSMMKRTEKKYPQYGVGALAQQMGLQLVEGNPTFNLLQGTVSHNDQAWTGVGGNAVRRMLDQAQETRVLMQGSPYGRPTEFVYYSYSEVNDRIAVRFLKHEFECRLSVHVPVNLPAFEIVGRKTAPGIKPKPEWDLPQQSFGDRDLDSRLRLSSNDPRIGAALAPVVGGLAGHRYVHIQGFKTIVQSICAEEATTFVAVELVETQHVLEHMANALAGPVRTG